LIFEAAVTVAELQGGKIAARDKKSLHAYRVVFNGKARRVGYRADLPVV
jgi:hypothetical protein